MDIKKIKEILNQDELGEYIQRGMILRVIAEDKDAILTVLKLLDIEREDTDNLIMDSNVELSRALVTLVDPNIGKVKPKPYIELSFVVGEIKKHYHKWQRRIKCCFKFDDLP